MSSSEWDDLDRVIEDTLSSEPFHRAPVGLIQRIGSRVRIEAAISKERKRLTNRVLGLSIGSVSVLVAVAAGIKAFDVLTRLWGAMPGAMGYADYLRSFYGGSGVSETLGLGVAFGAVAAVALLVGSLQSSWHRARRFSH
jgi:hypothetical protein